MAATSRLWVSSHHTRGCLPHSGRVLPAAQEGGALRRRLPAVLLRPQLPQVPHVQLRGLPRERQPLRRQETVQQVLPPASGLSRSLRRSGLQETEPRVQPVFADPVQGGPHLLPHSLWAALPAPRAHVGRDVRAWRARHPSQMDVASESACRQ